MHTQNTLLAIGLNAHTDTLPAFDSIQTEHIESAIDHLIDNMDQALSQVTADDFPARWSEISRVLDSADESLNRAFGIVSHLNSVADTPELRAAYNAAIPKIVALGTRISTNEKLYSKYKAIDSSELTLEQRQALNNALRGFRLSGADLQGVAKERHTEIKQQLAQLTQKFSENSLDATDKWSLIVSEEELDGVPQDVIEAAKAAAKEDGVEGCKLTLKSPCYLPIMQYGHNRDLRQTLYRASITRASNQAAEEFRHLDNGPVMAEIVNLRHESSQLLGFETFAHYSLDPKMARSPEEVIAFLRDLAQRARPSAEKDIERMRDFAREKLALDDPQPWDWTFIAERLKEAEYSFSQQELRNYFQAPKVLQGLFDLIENLFKVNIRRDEAPTWHPDVQFFRIERQGQLIAQFYLDQSARKGKRSGAWMGSLCSRWLRPDTQGLQTPVAYLVCNFSAGVGGKPALLTHAEVNTLFHEFGHGLHHMLTQVDEREVAGISGVEWDAVELPSQFMENFCWEWNTLEGMSEHIDTGKTLPIELFDKMIAAKNFQSGLVTLRQIEFGLFDMLLYSRRQTEPVTPELMQQVLQEVRNEVALVPSAPYARFANTFGHIFSGGYAAGYYSYKWAEVLSADAYAAFEEKTDDHGVLEHSVSQRFLEQILEVGGSRPAMESFKAFRGREPQIDALLRHQGLQAV